MLKIIVTIQVPRLNILVDHVDENGEKIIFSKKCSPISSLICTWKNSNLCILQGNITLTKSL